MFQALNASDDITKEISDQENCLKLCTCVLFNVFFQTKKFANFFFALEM
jgi:hypothetical protein